MAAVAAAISSGGTQAAGAPRCVKAGTVLWGDGRHDDTAALNAWFRGEDAVWAATGEPVGDTISGHEFRLSAAVYVPGGSGRVLRDFRMLWPERGEVVSGEAIRSGADADAPPETANVKIVGGDEGEGVAFEAPDIAPIPPDARAGCPVS